MPPWPVTGRLKEPSGVKSAAFHSETLFKVVNRIRSPSKAAVKGALQPIARQSGKDKRSGQRIALRVFDSHYCNRVRFTAGHPDVCTIKCRKVWEVTNRYRLNDGAIRVQLLDCVASPLFVTHMFDPS